MDTTRRLWVLIEGTFDDMDYDSRQMVRDQLSGRGGGISLRDWKLRLFTCMKEICQRSLSFYDWYAFDWLPQHLEFEGL